MFQKIVTKIKKGYTIVIELTQKQVSQLFKEGMKLEQVKTQTYNLEEKIYKTKNGKKVIHYIRNRILGRYIIIK